MSGLVNAISAPLKPSAVLELSVPPEMRLSFVEGLCEYAQNHSDMTLCNAVTTLWDTFPELSLWEKFKDFFGLSDTADNRRDTAILYAADMLAAIDITSEYNYDWISRALAQQLQEVGLAPVQENALMETLVAEALARLLDRNPQLADLITLQKTDFTTTSEPETVSLSGEVTFGSDRTDVPAFLKEMRLPFLTRAISPLLSGNTLHDHLRRRAEDEGGRALATLFKSLPPNNQLQLQLQSWSQGFPAVALFSVDGLLAGMASVPVGTTTRTVSDWYKLVTVHNKMQELPDSGQAFALIMPFSTFKHYMPKERTPEHEMLRDMHRGCLHCTDVMVNGVSLRNETLELMQTEALAAAEQRGNPEKRARDISEDWTIWIQKDLNTDKASAQRAAAAIIYMIFQGGAGRSNTGILGSAGPLRPQWTDNSLPDCKKKSMLHIDTRSGEGVLVAQAAFSTENRSGGGADSSVGAVVFRLPEPESGAATAVDMAAGFTRKNIHVAGFGVRYTDMSAFPAGQIYPYPDGWTA
ncbi:TPA: hypothetical protein ACQ39K_004908 [Yersinia enterocolitica]